MLAFSCSSCQKKLSVKEDHAGKKVKCPGCGNVIRIPASPALTQAATQTPDGGNAPASFASGAVEEKTVAPAVESKVPAPVAQQPTMPPSSNPGATNSPIPDKADHDSSLTDFLAPPQSDDELGRLGGYRILKILGHGGMGVVFQGEDPKLGRKVAIKAMLPHLAESRSAQERFLREARAAAALEHDHIVAIHHVGEDRGAPFIVMPFLKGEPLDARLRREKGMPIREVLRIGKEVAKGLAVAHKTGLIHRDIKPANIWLEEPEARVKILDFGLARATSQEAGLTQQGAIIGTPSYMAPEQARGEKVDTRCDLWSLGVVLYQLSTGELPFHGNDAVSTLMAVAMTDPPPPNELNPKLPARLSNLIMELLTKDPADRLADSQEVADTLREFAEKCGASDDFVAAKTETRPRAQFTQPAADEDTDSDRPRRKKKSTATMAMEERPRKHAKSRLPLYLGIGGGVAATVLVVVLVAMSGTRSAEKDSQPPDSGPVAKPLRPSVATGAPLSPLALVNRPPPIKGIESWSIEPRGHRGAITVAAYSPDSKEVATGGMDGTVRLWDPLSGQLRRILLGHGQRISCLAWSPDSKIIASGSHDKTVRLWQADTGKLLAILAKHSESIHALGWSPSGKTLATGSADKSVRLWNVTSGESQRVFDAHDQPIIDIAWRSETIVVSTSQPFPLNNTTLVWEAASGKSLFRHQSKGELNWSANHKTLLYRTSETAVTLWDAQTDKVRSLTLKEHKGNIWGLGISPDGKRIATGGKEFLQLWDATTGDMLSFGAQPNGRDITGATFSPDGKTVATNGLHVGDVYIWNVESVKKDEVIKPLRSVYVGDRGPAWSPNSKAVYAFAYSGHVRFADAETGKILHTPPVHNAGHDAAWLPDGKHVAIAAAKIRVWEVDSGRFVRAFEGAHLHDLVDWAPDGSSFVAMGPGGYWATVSSSQTGKPIKTFEAHTNNCSAISFSPDSKMVATAGSYGDSVVRLWEVATGKSHQLASWAVPDSAMAWAPDGQRLALGGHKVVTLWDTSSGKELPIKFQGPSDWVRAAAWSPDGKTLAAGDTQGVIWLWHAATGESFNSIKAHVGPISALAWLGDSKTFISLGDRDGTAHFWRADGDNPLRTVTNMPGWARFSPDRKSLISRFDPTRMQIWETETGRPRGNFIYLEGNPEQSLTISADGHYRISSEAWRHVVYVLQTERGQEIMPPDEFQKTYNWKNESERVHLLD